jgi:hypothetical protein
MWLRSMVGRKRKEWGNLDLNQGPAGYESAALTAELLPHEGRRIAGWGVKLKPLFLVKKRGGGYKANFY